jgi:hypothetical protein
MCDCGYVFGSPFRSSRAEGQTASPDSAHSSRSPVLPPSQPSAIELADVDLAPDKVPIEGFLVFAIVWLVLMVAGGVYNWLQVEAVISDDGTYRYLESRHMGNVNDYLAYAEAINLILVIAGIAMLISIFLFRRFARRMVFGFLIANLLAGLLDYKWSMDLANSSANRILEIEPLGVVGMLIGRIVSTTVLLWYFARSERVRRTFDPPSMVGDSPVERAPSEEFDVPESTPVASTPKEDGGAFRARQVRYLGLDREFLVVLEEGHFRLTPQTGLRAVAGPAAGYGAMFGGLLGALLGSLLDKRKENSGARDELEASNRTPDNLVFSTKEFVKNRLAAAGFSSTATMEGRYGDWKFRLTSGRRFHFKFDDPDQLSIAVHGLSELFGDGIEVNAIWSSKHDRFLPRSRWFG